ncbi:DUF5681 domain-containing protein [Rhodoferax mekongensis]|uniref:DUF5681 domain-containing protein n=1 Tax=Rhodoferax mekongensis TaxID=3068341 RepID=UPI0028BD93BA|nr:DUF5681 domain-containing protein [Rhodoferax sp. TBRC 17199]MDT7514683.1 DUF5681 domain-containing protein [Rhodoferax sp. TBRC 17199]
MTDKEKPKNRIGRWKAGESGNPKGRPQGTSRIQKLRDEIAKDLPSIVEKLRLAAKEGDIQAARLLIERVLPAVKPIDAPVNLSLDANASITDQGRQVLQAIASGELSTTHGSQLLTAMGTLAKVAEVDELANRLSVLEELVKQSKGGA